MALGLLAARAQINTGHDSEALAIAQRLRGAEVAATAEQLNGLVLLHRGETARGESLLRDALVAHKRQGDHAEAARDAYALGVSYSDDSRHRAAIEALVICREEAMRAGDRRLIGLAWLTLGSIVVEIGDSAAAETALTEAGHALQGFPADEAFVRLHEGILWLEDSHPALAKRAFAEALELARRSSRVDVEVAAHLNLAALAQDERQPQRMRSELDETRRLLEQSGQDPLREPAYLLHLALDAVNQGHEDDAQRWLARAATEAPHGYWAWRVQTAIGALAEKRHDMVLAEAAYRRAIASIEADRAALEMQELKCWLLERQREPYAALFVLLARAGRSAEAFGVFESLQARTLVDAFGRQGRPTAADSTAAASHSTVFDRILTRASSVSALSPDALLARLGARAVIGAVEAGEETWSLAVIDGHVHVRSLGASGPLAALATRLRQNPDDLDAATQLGVLVPPEAFVTSPARVLYFVASGLLANLPLAAVRVGGEPLVARRALALVPSATVLTRIAERPSLVLSPPAVFVDATEDLPYARREGSDVARALRAPLLAGRDVTRARVQSAAHAAVLHLATHAGVDANGSWVQLADGRLRASDVLELHLQPRLAVLASCGSAAARDRESWGSIASAFLAAGTRTVVATLWSVGDDTAADMSVQFYAAGGATDPARALARVQHKAAATRPAAEWAPFVVIGDAEYPEGRSWTTSSLHVTSSN